MNVAKLQQRRRCYRPRRRSAPLPTLGDAILRGLARTLPRAVEQSPLAIMITNRRGVIQYVNPGFTALTGYSLADALGRTPRFLKSGQTPPETYQALWDEIIAGREWRGELLNRRKSGELYWEAISIAPVSDAAGSITHFVAFKEDITLQRQAAFELAQSEERFRGLIEQAPVAIGMGRDGLEIYNNPAFWRFFGYQPGEQPLGLPIIERVAPHCRAEYNERTQRREQGQPGELVYEMMALRRDGTEFPVSAAVAQVQLADGPATLVFLNDLTERVRAEQALRESEDRFRGLVEQAPVAILISRAERPVYANRRLLDLLGRPGFDLQNGPPIYEYFAPGYQEGSRERIRRRAQGLSVPEEVEAMLQRGDGSQFPVRFFTTVVHLADGPAQVSFVEDITAQKRAGEQLSATLEQLHTLSGHLQTVREEERTAIAREIHDELGQALTGLKMDLFWLKGMRPKTSEAEFAALAEDRLAGILGEIDKTINLVRNISTSLRPSILDTLGLIPALDWLARDFSLRSGIPCTFKNTLKSADFSKSLVTAIFRICQESLTNVARHANATRVRVELGSKHTLITLSVQDNGRGVTPEDVANPASFGILGMRERAYAFNGSIEYRQPAAGGTEMLARFPRQASLRLDV